jgi:hypothetical protein
MPLVRPAVPRTRFGGNVQRHTLGWIGESVDRDPNGLTFVDVDADRELATSSGRGFPLAGKCDKIAKETSASTPKSEVAILPQYGHCATRLESGTNHDPSLRDNLAQLGNTFGDIPEGTAYFPNQSGCATRAVSLCHMMYANENGRHPECVNAFETVL